MSKLHQHIAVESNVKTGEEKIRNECMKTFREKTHYDGIMKQYIPTDAELETITEEYKHVVDTVPDKLEYVHISMIRLFDYIYQKELANQKACSDLIIKEDDKEIVIAKDVPATMLLSLEKKLQQIRDLYAIIPTCDPAKKWIKDPSETNKFKTEPEEKIRNKKEPFSLVKYHATTEHPAQVEIMYREEPIGKLQTTYMTGKITPAEKSKLLGRIDTLLRAVIKSRQNANEVEMTKDKIGKDIFKYIHG
jgi:hypothetical protein